MNITFYGAARTVTGSCFCLEVGEYKCLVDCGLFQGGDSLDTQSLPFDPSKIDAVLLTHAHIDHAGRLPLLEKNGFKGQIFATEPTLKLSQIMLKDSAHIQEQEALWAQKKAKRGGLFSPTPLYTTKDAENVIKHFEKLTYSETVEILPSIKVRAVDAGHLLGSASFEVWLTEKGQTKKIVFSGDLGNYNQPLIKNSPTYIRDADFVVCESTYGDVTHPVETKHITSLERAKVLSEIVDQTFKKGGNVIIPAFAVGRSQELLYLFKIIEKNHLLPYRVPVYLDSPMAMAATKVFGESINEYFDDESKEIYGKGENGLELSGLTITQSTEDSRRLNELDESAVIISSSGMCEAGRIKHHLKHNLWRSDSAVVFCGYQASGTLGRSILDGAKHVTIFGEQIDVRAQIYSLKSLSGHADQTGIIDWLKYFTTSKEKPQEVFVVHGEESNAVFFSGYIGKELSLSAYAPRLGESFDLLAAKFPFTEYRDLEDSGEMKALKSALELEEKRLNGLIDLSKAFKRKGENLTHRQKGEIRSVLNTVLRFSNDIGDLIKKWGKDL